jgi:hypothetical protein
VVVRKTDVAVGRQMWHSREERCDSPEDRCFNLGDRCGSLDDRCSSMEEDMAQSRGQMWQKEAICRSVCKGQMQYV